jgi:chemotaxis protein histidine kinase CheA
VNTKGQAGEEILGMFRKVAAERVQKISTGFSLFLSAGSDDASAERVARELYTFKGELRIMGFLDAEKIVAAVENTLKNLRQKAVSNASAVQELTLDALEKVKSNVVQGAKISADEVCRKIRDFEEAEAKKSAPAGAQKAVSNVDQQLRNELLGSFRKVCKERVETITKSFPTVLQDPSNVENVTSLLREVHTLKGESKIMGFVSAWKVVVAIEDVLKHFKASSFSSAKGFDEMLAKSLDLVYSIVMKDTTPDVEDMCSQLSAWKTKTGS